MKDTITERLNKAIGSVYRDQYDADTIRLINAATFPVVFGPIREGEEVEPDRPPVYPMPFVNLTNNRRASATHWADSHMNYCTANFRYWTGNSNGQSFSHADRGVNY